MNAVAIIPARGGSKRLPGKNLQLALGKPLLGWVIEAALGSRHLGPGRVFVSTEAEPIADVARQFGADVVDRPAELAGDGVWTEPVIQHAVESLERAGHGIELVVWLNASVPEVQGSDIDHAVERLLAEDLREITAVDRHWRCYSAVRVLRRETLFQRRLSVVCGVLPLGYLDIHTAGDLRAVEERLRQRSSQGDKP